MKYATEQSPDGMAITSKPIEWPRPIPVTERLPEISGYYLLCCTKLDSTGDCHWSDVLFADGQFVETDVNGEPDYPLDLTAYTHWLPMPPAP